MIIKIIILFNKPIFVIFFKSNILIFWGIIMNYLVNNGIYFFERSFNLCIKQFHKILYNCKELFKTLFNYIKFCEMFFNYTEFGK